MEKLEDLKQELDKKIDKEYEEFITDLKGLPSEQIIKRSYEKVCKEEMVYKIKDRNYDVVELKALLKNDNILAECYDEWLDTDVHFNELLEDSVNDRIEMIVEEYENQEESEDESEEI